MTDIERKPYPDHVYSKMNPEIKAKWVAALRSQKYPQTHGALNRTVSVGSMLPGYCCLGVLCEVGVEAGVVERRQTPGRDVEYRHIAEGTFWVGTMPANETNRWAQLDQAAESDLTEMNDDGGRDFDFIANFIEERL